MEDTEYHAWEIIFNCSDNLRSCRKQDVRGEMVWTMFLEDSFRISGNDDLEKQEIRIQGTNEIIQTLIKVML